MPVRVVNHGQMAYVNWQEILLLERARHRRRGARPGRLLRRLQRAPQPVHARARTPSRPTSRPTEIDAAAREGVQPGRGVAAQGAAAARGRSAARVHRSARRLWDRRARGDRDPGAAGSSVRAASSRAGPSAAGVYAAAIYARGVDLARRLARSLRLRERVLLAAVALQQARAARRGASSPGYARRRSRRRGVRPTRAARARLRAPASATSSDALDGVREPVMYDFVHTNEAGRARRRPRHLRASCGPTLRGWRDASADERPRDQRLLPRLGRRAGARRRLVAAAQEERFTRRKHDERLPVNAIRYCLRGRRVGPRRARRRRLLRQAAHARSSGCCAPTCASGPAGCRLVPPGDAAVAAREAVDPATRSSAGCAELGYRMPDDLYFTEHHESHAASAFFPSPFEAAAVLTFDGVGEWATSSIGVGEGNRIELQRQIFFPHSLGLLYSAFTYLLRLPGQLRRVQADGPRALRRAALRRPHPRRAARPARGRLVPAEHALLRLPGRPDDDQPPLRPSSSAARRASRSREITRREMDLARSIQEVHRGDRAAHGPPRRRDHRQAQRCLAGGVALNCVANGRLLREGPFERIWIQPAAGRRRRRARRGAAAGTRSPATRASPTARPTA